MPMQPQDLTVQRLCMQHTPLLPDEVARIEQLAHSLPLVAELAGADVFIDCLTRSRDVAIVVAEANPPDGRSLYRAPVLGQLALRENEPGVLETLLTGRPTPGRRGVTQEGRPVRQSVVPVRSDSGQTIGAFIMEQDISQQVRQEAQLGLLSETTEQLTETLLSMAMRAQALPSLLHEGLLILDPKGRVSYANPIALRFLSDLGGPDDPVGRPVTDLPLGYEPGDLAESKVISRELQAACATFQLRAIPLGFQPETEGQIILLRDVTEIRLREKELMIKSVVIKEIHHRVKNNLQTIASLLRLQARRIENLELRRIFGESINRIASIATVHEALSKGGIELVDLRAVTTDILRLIRGGMLHPDRDITIETKGDSLFISSDKATSVALIMNEVVQNALDHAFPGMNAGRVEVALDDRGDRVQVTVTDNGVGLPDTFRTHASANLGLQIVRTLVEHDLKGSLSIGRSATGGTEVIICFPKAEGERQHVGSDPAAGRR